MDEEMPEPSESLEEANQVSGPGDESKEGRMGRALDDSEDDQNQVVKQRMRGLKDLGIMASSSSKRKRSQTAHVQEFFKRKNRRRPLTKVLECSTTVLSVPDLSEQLIPKSSCGSPPSESIENRTSQNVSERTCVASSLLPDKHTAGLVPSLISPKLRDVVDGQSCQSIQDITKSSGNKESVESDSTSSAVVDIKDISQRLAEGVSKWKSKGKRNSRHLGKCEVTAGSSIQTDRLLGWNWTSGFWAPQSMLPYRQSQYAMNLGHHIPIRGYDPDSSLYDAHLEVKASYRSHHVPYISLMSKLNGRAIIGHPITVKVLDESVCDHLLRGGSGSKLKILKDDIQNNSADLEHTHVGLKANTNQGSGQNSVKNLKESKSPNTRKNGLTSKKIRRLSSITGPQKRFQNEKNKLVEKVKGPVIACVPLKVVFSRINASFNSSMRVHHSIKQ